MTYILEHWLKSPYDVKASQLRKYLEELEALAVETSNDWFFIFPFHISETVQRCLSSFRSWYTWINALCQQWHSVPKVSTNSFAHAKTVNFVGPKATLILRKLTVLEKENMTLTGTLFICRTHAYPWLPWDGLGFCYLNYLPPLCHIP